jgi:hypothetical protein
MKNASLNTVHAVFHLEYVDSRFLQNIGKHLPDYVVSHLQMTVIFITTQFSIF